MPNPFKSPGYSFSNRFILIVVCASFVPSLSALAEASITVSLEPANTTIEIDGANDPLVIDICIDNPDQQLIRSWSLDLYFDPAVFEPRSGVGSVPTQGLEIGDYIPSVVGQWNPYYESNGASPDVARMGALNFGTQTGSALIGLLSQVSLDVIGTSTSSPLWLQGQIILNDNSEADNVVFQSTQIVVNTPEPATVLLLLAGLSLYRRQRRRL